LCPRLCSDPSAASFGMRGDTPLRRPTTPPLLIVKWNKKHSSLTGMTTVWKGRTMKFVRWLASRHCRSNLTITHGSKIRMCSGYDYPDYDAFFKSHDLSRTHTYGERFYADTAASAIFSMPDNFRTIVSCLINEELEKTAIFYKSRSILRNSPCKKDGVERNSISILHEKSL